MHTFIICLLICHSEENERSDKDVGKTYSFSYN